MPRIVFSDGDLDRVTVAERPHVMWETVLSLHVLQHDDGADVFDVWRRTVEHGLGESSLREAVRRLCELDPNDSYFPDFLTPDISDLSPVKAIRRVVSTPPELVREEIDRLCRRRPRTAWLRDLGRDPRATAGVLRASLSRYYRLAIEPLESELVETVARESQRRRSALRRGVAALFDGFDPEVMRWDPPVLDVLAPGADVELRGRGLVLIPSTFCWQRAVTPAKTSGRPTVVYPAARDVAVGATCGPGRPLQALLGRRRAAVLAAVSSGSSTGAVASRLELPASSVSEHLAVLRDAGLVTSGRQGRSIEHRTTALGELLLGRAE
ncbi:ArsR/SmtB family transcription factor [Nocardioides mangrovicus]|uniref:ArsR/SmtB family transcription factor n=1 Tax=Nocardioides mangrovicus TaxID=2478913 RepID=UPI0011C43F31|nr:winged helix-turn-helix domain-containing protein [Nocardioides mangrovicus]